MTINELIAKKEFNLENVPGAFADGVKTAQGEIWEEMASIIQQIERKGDQIVMSKKNLQLIDKLLEQIKKVALKSDYITAIKAFSKDIDAQKKINTAYFDKAFTETLGNLDFADAVWEVSKKNSVQTLVNAVDSEFISAAKGTLENAISTGASWKDTVKNLKTITVGNSEVEGKLYRYAKQTASDAFSISDRTYTNAVSDNLGLEFYLYAGDKIAATRPFCDERVGKYFHKKEIEAMASKDWDGKIRGTDSKTIFVLAGGWSCKHSWLPVSAIVVPKDVLKRNIANGNYKPSEKEKEMLGIAA